ncbi:MAG: hypothetical protein MUF31_18265 [Akkermansiaceae bacterium]|jgi:hypothetical protein|nr:hypothetical protein [Akkermansiaceae bacterium]
MTFLKSIPLVILLATMPWVATAEAPDRIEDQLEATTRSLEKARREAVKQEIEIRRLREELAARDKSSDKPGEISQLRAELQTLRKALRELQEAAEIEALKARNDRARIEQAEIEARHATERMLEAQGIAAVRKKEVDRLETELAITREALRRGTKTADQDSPESAD